MFYSDGKLVIHDALPNTLPLLLPLPCGLKDGFKIRTALSFKLRSYANLAKVDFHHTGRCCAAWRAAMGYAVYGRSA